MNATIIVVGIVVVALIVWLWRRHRNNYARNALAERDRILQELREIEVKRQGLINEAGQRGVTVSTDGVLKHVEEVRQSYLSSGQEEAAHEVERVIREFREANGPEIPVEKAYALMKELENKYGRS